MYSDETSCMNVLVPRVQLGLWSWAERRRRLGFYVVACRHMFIAPPALSLISIEHANWLHHRRLISTLIRLGSKFCRS
jgi:hypothetical protein